MKRTKLHLPRDCWSLVLQRIDLDQLAPLFSNFYSVKKFITNKATQVLHGRVIRVRDVEDLQFMRIYRVLFEHAQSIMLDLSACELAMPNLQALARQLAGQVRGLRLARCTELDDTTLNYFIKMNSQCLQILDLSGCQRLSNGALQSIGCILGSKLEHLNISNCLFTNGGIQWLSECHQLRSMNMSNCYMLRFTYSNTLYLPKNLRSLDLSGIYGLDRYALQNLIVEPLRELSLLRLFDADDLLTKVDIQMIASSLEAQGRSLDIQHNIKLENESEAGIRAYVLSLIVLPVSMNAIES